MGDAIELLQQLGFGEYEARAYSALLQRSPLNGYELAKVSGVPRGNVYGVLDKLAERGAVVRLDTPDGTRYAPVPAPELIERLRNRYQEALDDAESMLSEITSPAEHEYVWNTRGYAVMLEHARALAGAAESRLLVATWPQEAHELAGTLAEAEARGVAITTHCLAGCLVPCGACRGQIYRYGPAAGQETRWLVVVSDGAEVLAGEAGPDAEAVAIRTRQRLLVDLTTWYIRRSIALAAVVHDLGERLGELLAPEARSVLAAMGPGYDGEMNGNR